MDVVITPVSNAGKLLTVAPSALGFTMFAAMASYLIEVVNGLSARNRLALAIHDEIQDRTGDVVLAQFLAHEGVDQARQRCRAWAEHLRTVDELVHRYPLVAFTYRSRRVEYDPEPALRHCAEAAVAPCVASRDEPALRTAAEERDHQSVAETERRLEDHLGPQAAADSSDDHAAVTAFRGRVFLTGLQRWSRADVTSRPREKVRSRRSHWTR